jgi:hypothetical protein
MPEVDVNNVAVLVAAIVSMVLGAIWHGPLFGKVWMKAAGKTQKDIDGAKGEMPKMYAITFIGALVTAYILAVFIGWAGANTIALAVILSFLIWLGFVVTSALGPVVWENRNQQLFLISVSYSFVSLIIMAAIIVLLPA